jgi:hypothetical protein
MPCKIASQGSRVKLSINILPWDEAGNNRKGKEEERMKKVLTVMCAALLAGTAAMATPAFAADPKPASVTGYVQGGYTYNTNTPASQENDYRVFDHKANSRSW